MIVCVAGLREEKKAETRESLLKIARKTFLERGFSETTIAQIAKKAKVAVGTVYNYFPSKSQLLLAILFEEMAVQTGKEQKVRRQKSSVAEMIISLLETLIQPMLDYPKTFWREILAAIAGDNQENLELRKGLIFMDQTYMQEIHSLLVQARKCTEDDTRLMEIIYSVLVVEVTAFVYMDDVPFSALMKSIGDKLRFLLDGTKLK